MLHKPHSPSGQSRLTQLLHNVASNYFEDPVRIQCRQTQRVWTIYSQATIAGEIDINGMTTPNAMLLIRSEHPFTGEMQYGTVQLNDLLPGNGEFVIIDKIALAEVEP